MRGERAMGKREAQAMSGRRVGGPARGRETRRCREGRRAEEETGEGEGLVRRGDSS